MALNVVPTAGQTLNASQPLIAANFANIDTGFAIEHVAFNLGDQGKHKTATFPSAAAPAAVAATEVGLYAATHGASTELFINKTATQIPFTASLKAVAGWTYLPSGIILQWTTGTLAGGSASNTFNLPIAFPTGILSCQATPSAASTGNERDIIIYSTILGVQQVRVGRSAGWAGSAISFNIFAIGY